MKLAANIGCLFAELPFMERFAAAKEAGFAGVEVNAPYDHSGQEMRSLLLRHGLDFVNFMCPPPNFTGGERGFAAVPGGSERFRRDFARSLRYADLLKTRHITIMAGRARGIVAHKTFVENLKWAAACAPARSLLIEPMSMREFPDYFLESFWQANEILDEVACPNVGLLFDAFQAQSMSENLMGCWAAHGRHARHIQVAGLPDRREPEGAGVDWKGFLQEVSASGYKGWISAEYTPRGLTLKGLGWMKDMS